MAFVDWWNRIAEAPIDVTDPAEARRKAPAKALREARAKARTEALAEVPVYPVYFGRQEQSILIFLCKTNIFKF